MRKWLYEIRKSKSMTMKNVADEAGIAECYYCQIENGTRNVPVKTAIKIANAIGFDWQMFYIMPNNAEAEA